MEVPKLSEHAVIAVNVIAVADSGRHVLGAMLSVSIYSLISHNNPLGRCYYCPHSADKEKETQRG